MQASYIIVKNFSHLVLPIIALAKGVSRILEYWGLSLTQKSLDFQQI